MDRQREPIEKKLALEFFVKIIYATPLVFLFSFFIHPAILYPMTAPHKVSFN